MTYKEIKARFRKVGLGVVRWPTLNKYVVYFLSGSQKGRILSNATGLEGLEKLLEINHG